MSYTKCLMEDEKDLITKAQKGDREAFGHIYKKYVQKIYRYCSINAKDEELAKDICQECFVKAWKTIKSFKTSGNWSFQAFLFTIARNLIIDNSRKKKGISLEAIEDLPDINDIYSEMDRKEEIKKVRFVLSKLDEVERQIMILRYFENMPSAEVAKILKIKDGAVRVRTLRIMQKMKAIFEVLYGKRN